MKAKAVIIDSSEITRNQIKNVLESIDIEVIGEAADGFEGLNMILKLDPTLIIVAQRMPKMTGEELMRKLTKYSIDIQTILLSEKTPDRQALYDNMVEFGVNDIIEKPITDDVLKRIASKVFETND